MTPSILFDRKLLAARTLRARPAGPDILVRTAAADLADRLDLVVRTFDRALLIAPDPAAFSETLRKSGRIGTAVLREPGAGDDLGLAGERFDAVFSILDLHAANDVPGRIAQMVGALRPDGLFLACLFAGETLTELRQSWLAAEAAIMAGATPRVAPMIAMGELGALLQRSGLALPVADLDRTVARYADAFALMREIRSLGLSNCLAGRSRHVVSRRLLLAAAEHYRRHFADPDGRVRATLDIAWLTGWSPHESQPQPLRPGSAKARLADALNTVEVRLKGD